MREYDVHKLMQVLEPIDIFLSHDWPCGITDYGNLKNLLRQKPFFEKEVGRIHYDLFSLMFNIFISQFFNFCNVWKKKHLYVRI